MKIAKINLKSNKGFTMHDLAIAIFILMIFAGTIGGIYVSIYQTQVDANIDSIATIFAVQCVEYIDKIAYEQITEETKQSLQEELKNKFSIPDTFNIQIEIVPLEKEQDLVKTVKLTINYNFSNEEKSIIIERLKVKEI